MVTENKRFGIILLAIGGLLSIPLIAMQFNTGVDWNWFDFLVMGGLMLIVGTAIEFVLRTVKKTAYRIMLLAAILLMFLLTWAELAVGIFGTPFAGS